MAQSNDQPRSPGRPFISPSMMASNTRRRKKSNALFGFNNASSMLDEALKRGNSARKKPASKGIKTIPKPAPKVTPSAPMFGKTLADYLAGAGDGSGLITSQLAALEGLRNSGRQQQATGDSEIAAMYAALENSLRADREASQQRYAGAEQASKENTGEAQATIDAAAKAAQQAQNETLKNLGISGANKQSAATQAGYTSTNTAGNQQIGNATVQNLIERGASDSDLITQNVAAAGFRGANRRADLQQELMDYLSGLAGQEAQLRDSAAQQARDEARAQYEADYSNFWQNQQYGDSRDDEAWSRAMQEAELNGQSQQQIDPTDLKGQDAVVYSMQNAGVPARAQQAILNTIYSGLSNAGSLTKNGTTSPYAAAYAAVNQAVADGTIPSQYATLAFNAALQLSGSGGLS